MTLGWLEVSPPSAVAVATLMIFPAVRSAVVMRYGLLRRQAVDAPMSRVVSSQVTVLPALVSVTVMPVMVALVRLRTRKVYQRVSPAEWSPELSASMTVPSWDFSSQRPVFPAILVRVAVAESVIGAGSSVPPAVPSAVAVAMLVSRPRSMSALVRV
ncbi:Uncharacterised protein [Dermatophilus congolensis]|uniref:Uncharacterized protein n=1 Tax=Dermatophilus congolensis TaxID=1863 RepID=A0AA46BQ06_9MICO|nr:Uncharacterised protein [Dermatophilus congolensis]